jgi:predicted dehydrogenase
MVRRSKTLAPEATQTPDYKTMLADKEITAVVIATPTHQHKEIVLEALAAGKHVYCEAPLAHTIDDAREIAKAAKANPQLVFQAGLQLRSDKQRHFLIPFIRSGALGQFVVARAQWHKKQSWRATSPSPEREQVLNWRLDKALSTGLVGELGIHQIDQALWFINARPEQVTGFGRIALWKDGREVPDTAQAIFEFPGKLCLNWNATLANSFDASYEMFHGSDAAVMLRDTSAWMFKEVDSPMLGWEVYARKDLFYKETGIVLKADASKSTAQTEAQIQEQLIKSAPLYTALENFVRNAYDLTTLAHDMVESFGEADPEELAKVARRASAGYEEGFIATALAIKANEAILKGERIQITPELYELG